ncbi:MAG: SDR family oxidoreductase [Actinomycetota bacterium]
MPGQDAPPEAPGGSWTLGGKTALVTGGTSGIGLGVARRFVGAGAEVVGLARHARPELEQAGARLVLGDVADEHSFERAVAQVRDLVGRVDVLVLNAGVSDLDGDDLGSMSTQVFRRLLEVNTLGVFHGLRLAPDLMRDGGSIIITATGALWWPFPDYMAYSASKAPLHAMCAHAAMKLGQRRIRVNTISPGTIVTEMQPDDDAEATISALATCLGRYGEVDDVVGAYHFLASDESRYVTGTDLRVDGGWLGGVTYPEASRLLGNDA